jgi:murein DD-endopeptidase MepM/ murein hydrolase activator NlpD
MFAAVPDVFAPESGVVERVSDGKSVPFQGYGPGVILIRGDSGFYHLLSHLNFSTISVAPGQRIFDGQRIAQFDREIAHTHYEVRREPIGPSATNTIDPAVWLAAQQRKLVATAPPVQPSNTGIKLVAVMGLFGLGWLALRIARHAATAPSRFV